MPHNVFMYVFMYVSMYVYVNKCMYLCMYVFMYVHMHLFVYIFMYMFNCLCIAPSSISLRLMLWIPTNQLESRVERWHSQLLDRITWTSLKSCHCLLTENFCVCPATNLNSDRASNTEWRWRAGAQTTDTSLLPSATSPLKSGTRLVVNWFKCFRWEPCEPWPPLLLLMVMLLSRLWW